MKSFKETKLYKMVESSWLCLRFPFLYPRNRFTGRHCTNVLGRLIRKLYKDSVQEISITATQEKGDITPREKFYNNIYLTFLDYRVELEKHNKKLFIWRTKDKIKHEVDLAKILYNDDKFEIIGTSLIFAISGKPIVKVHVKVKDENDTNDYGFCFNNVEIITNKWKHFWHDIISWIDCEILDRILFIPTFTELDAMEPGWRKAFGIQLCKELKAQLKKDKYLYKYRITQIKEKWGYLHWYDCGASKEVHDIISKYENISWNTCLVCGKPATKISSGWILPYCDDCYPKEKVVYQEKVDGEWKETKEYKKLMKKIEEEK